MLPEVVELIWSDSDIRSFIARRIAINLIKTLKLGGLEIVIDEEKLYLESPRRKKTIFAKVKKYIYKILNIKSKHDKSEARRINMNDEISRNIILTLFPSEILHKIANGGEEKSDIFLYFSNHFDFGDEHTTPRIILLFLIKLVIVATTYYRENKDQVELIRENKCIRTFKKRTFPSGLCRDTKRYFGNI